MTEAKDVRVAVLIAPGFQDEEGTEPVTALREAGIHVDYVGLETGKLQGKGGRAEVTVDAALADVSPEDYTALYIPGGTAPERLRLEEPALAWTRHFFEAGKPVATICHGPQVLISAGVLAGRTLTCVAGIRDDVRLAGARYRDKPVVRDGNLLSSRTPKDLETFGATLVEMLTSDPTSMQSEETAATDD